MYCEKFSSHLARSKSSYSSLYYLLTSPTRQSFRGIPPSPSLSEVKFDPETLEGSDFLQDCRTFQVSTKRGKFQSLFFLVYFSHSRVTVSFEAACYRGSERERAEKQKAWPLLFVYFRLLSAAAFSPLLTEVNLTPQDKNSHVNTQRPLPLDPINLISPSLRNDLFLVKE